MSHGVAHQLRHRGPVRTRPALLAVLPTVLGTVLLGVGWLVLQPSPAGIGQVPAPISVPAGVVPPATAPAGTTAPSSPTDVVPPPPLDDDDGDDGDTDGPDDVDDDGED